MKPLFPTLWGNERQKQQFGAQIMRGTLAHAYLIQGKKGTGKCYFAHLLAAALSCENRNQEDHSLPCGMCDACRKILSDGTPDIRNITRGENASVGIDAIRLIKEDMYLSPTEMEKKVYIIHEAEKMTVAAQNALLVALEEPPMNVLLLLLCENEASLLPTVRSRVQTIRMSRLEGSQLDIFLQSNAEARTLAKEKPDRYRDILTIADGSPGVALELLQSKNLHTITDIRNTILNMLSCINSRTGYFKLHQAMAKLPPKRQEVTEQLSYFLLAIRDLILIKHDEAVPLCFWSDRDDAIERASLFNFRCLYTVYDAVREALIELGKNANITVTLVALTHALAHAPIQYNYDRK